MTRRLVILVAALGGLLAVSAAWSYAYMVSERNAALTAEADRDDCLRMARRGRELSTRPTLATERERLASEITGLIEKAAQTAGLTPESLSRITPEPPRRLGDTAYKEKPTQVFLKRVTLMQVVTLVHSLLEADAGLHANSIRLTVPREDEAAGHWNAELVLTYLIYDPPRPEKEGAPR